MSNGFFLTNTSRDLEELQRKKAQLLEEKRKKEELLASVTGGGEVYVQQCIGLILLGDDHQSLPLMSSYANVSC